MPLKPSLQVKVTVTTALSQPFWFGAGAMAAEIFGGVRSILTLTETVAVLPALSRAVPEIA